MGRLNIKHLFLLSMLFFGMAILSISYTGRVRGEQKAARYGQKVFSQKEKLVYNAFEQLEKGTEGEEQLLNANLIGDGVSIFKLKGDSLLFWSDNSLEFGADWISHTEGNLLTVLHKTYCCIIDSSENQTRVGMIHLTNDFPYENEFLRNGILNEFKQPRGAGVTGEETAESHQIVFNDGTIAFYLDYEVVGTNENMALRILGTLFFFLGVFFLLSILRAYLRQYKGKRASTYALGIIFALIALRIVFVATNVLGNQFLMFNPFLYATKIAPSYGDLILNSIIFLFISYTLLRYVQLPESKVKYAFNRNAWAGILNLIFVGGVVYINHVSVSLISHSSLEVVVHNISQLRFPVVLAYAMLAMNYLGLIMIAFWIYENLNKVQPYRLIINCCVQLILALLISVMLKSTISLFSIVFALLIYGFVGYFRHRIRQQTILSTLVYFLLVFSVFIMLFMVHLSEKKKQEHNESLAISLSTEHDPIAEYLFSDISKELHADTVISNQLYPERFDILELYSYIQKNYFNAYWKKYALQITVCRAQDSVLVSDNDVYWYPCYDFFEESISNYGLQIPSSDFFYIDKLTGLINYLGWIKYKLDTGEELSVFIELDSKLTTQPLGYPELLLDEGLQSNDELADISYAKYHKNKLVSHTGKFEYSLISRVFEEEDGIGFRRIKHNGFEHLVHKLNDENLIVVSEPEIKFIDYLVLFSYVFLFYYLTALLITFLLVSQYRHLGYHDSLRNRIQFSIIAILIVSLVLIAGSTTWFNVRKYNQTQSRIIEEKINSVYVELEHKLAFEDSLTSGWYAPKYDNLDQLLIKFSDVFYSDINLYSPEGRLLATSRNEVFQLGLQSRLMNPLAYRKMNEEHLARFVNRERIHELGYLSAYVPFLNNQGEVLAYLNLPYFTKQKELQEDITTITVAIVNIYVLLILLTIIIAVLISDQITKPLEMIQVRFRELKLGAKYEPIEYARNDEIGRLVKEYNGMVMELERNVELLAKSERESAWREMAKQVAHEIKNPLTPMRLSVQQLKRTWDDKREGFDSYLNRVSITLIEQIDNLSQIASEFSNFAKMPVAEIREVNLYEVLKNSVDLFKANERVKVNLSTEIKDASVLADADQLGRVFINLIKNGIQAIPETENGVIELRLELDKEMAVVKVIDNGKGIPEEIKGKLFTPNFTTKSSGMGLGLAIVKNILDGIDGAISLTTKVKEGTTFIVKIPLAQN